MDSNLMRFIREEIRRQMNIILTGSAGTNTQFSEDIDDLFPGMPTIVDRPVMHPYGISSRAPAKTIQVVARQGEHFGNRLVIGHRDAKRPAVDVGETSVYSLGTYEVRVLNGKVQVGKGGTFETVVVGETLKQLLIAILDSIIKHKHITSAPGALTSPPDNAAEFTDEKANFLSNDKILAKDGGRF